ncbi:NrfD/PsrC family molybdoenzyme membrane anchor subunit [Candidatus Uabimicrobium sp. HlEnr_7]|uniref:NrfD/PsrC family molybdoenzyme membrane anchor subunit n=1 Tax=Candidatus Uabimicrobium helgolandensis TaxID=3095367 RepID=UPI0035574EC3
MTQENTAKLTKDELDDAILGAMEKPTIWYWVALAVSAACFFFGIVCCWGYQMVTGLGVSGLNNPVGWGVYITDFVFWVGIAHSGTLISAVLFLFRAKWRCSFNRSAEAMTVFAVMTAGLFPLIHLGRVWLFYWLMPYPNQRQLWVNFRSPLVWDVFAVSTYFTISAIFFYVGMLPDLAIVRRKATGIRKLIYGALSIGWKGTQKQWKHYNQLYMFLAAFATPLVISVHSVVSWDFAMGIVPGWHTTIFPPYFVAGAIFSGCAMVITLVVPMRKIFRLERVITIDHFESLAKLMLVTSIIVTYAYIVEFCIAFYSGNVFEAYAFKYRLVGDYWIPYWIMLTCNSMIPFLVFFKKIRRNLTALFIISIFANIGMWFERFNIFVISLSHDFSPYSWGMYYPSLIEIGITIGSFGWFFLLFLIFAKTLPIVAITEVKEIISAPDHH